MDTPFKDLPKSYDPKLTEPKWISFWEENDFFKANPHSSKPSFCIVIPPPNVTGVLHMGHALVNTLQDILTRWKRMEGFETLWVPGTDHAGIATQTVVERYLMATQQKRRIDFSREEFLSYVWQWKERHENTILSQLKRMGCSCDWSRLRFTMDEGCNKAVRTIFKKMFDEGFIYRGDYLVNWDPVTLTALADDEVEYEERSSFLWHFKYPLKDGSGFIEVATTRPETMLGDTGIAVSLKDERYSHLVGKTVILPLMNREIPIIADHHVDPTFGTGVVKITPAHDPNDYEMGLNHNLEFINIFTPDAKINENGGEFEGLSRDEARTAIVEKMKELGYLVKIEPHTLRIGLSYRSKAVIEPYLSKQWFVKMERFGTVLKDVIETGEVKIIPKTWESTYFNWVNHLRDWCISRQLWWGHRIPVWYNKSNPDQMICHDGDDLPDVVKNNPHDWVQDEDVLDTWFSSALWPFSTLGWPNNTAELAKFYPNSVLVTGHDILFFWVARMVFMGEYALGKAPFPETFLHGLIYGKSYWRENPNGGITYITGQEKKNYDLGEALPNDVKSKWEKLSKSKGNVIDPLELIEDYGTDAMRMALAASATHQPQIDLDRRRFEEFKNFANKIWNGARFVLMNLAEDDKNGLPGLSAQDFSNGLKNEDLKLEDQWILSSLNRTIKEVKKALTNYSFDQAALIAYEFFWKEFCAFYVEIAKPVLFGKSGTKEERLNKQKLLTIILSSSIRLLHPMAPFITEELFQILKEPFAESGLKTASEDSYTEEALKSFNCKSCSVAPYPLVNESDIREVVEKDFEFINKVLYCIRNIRGEMKIAPSQAIEIHIVGSINSSAYKLLEQNLHILSSLVKIEKIVMTQESISFKFSSSSTVEDLKIVIPLPLELQAKERERLEKEREKLFKLVERLSLQLENNDFLSKAKPELIEQQKRLLSQSMSELQEINAKLK